MLSLLMVARWLEPDPRGRGTHEQLDLPPCGFLLIFGKPCPSCGMTTSWSHVTRGQFLSSIHANAGGFLMAIAAAVAGSVLIGSAIKGQWIVAPSVNVVLFAAITVILAALLHWVFKLFI